MTAENKVLGFIGAGMMASALIKGIAKAGLVPAKNCCGTDVAEVSRKKLESLGAKAYLTAKEVVAASDLIFLSVKPHIVPIVLDDIKGVVTNDKLVISIAAGVTIASIEGMLPQGSRVVRVMPNTPCSVGQSASGYVAGTHATTEDMKFVGQILNSVGLGIEVQEKDLNAVTGVSGSGPAYIFILIEALADGGVRAGLTRDVAMKLAAQTVKGAAQMVLETGEHPGVLKDQVCSAGGTTITAVEALERGGFRGTVMNAVTSAKLRADELSRSNM